MIFLRPLLFVCPLVCLMAQTPPPTAVATPAPAGTPAAVAPAPAPEVPPDRVVITVGDRKVTAAEFEAMIAAMPAQYQTAARGPGRKQFVDGVVRMFALAEEGKRRKIDQETIFKTKVAFDSANILATLTAEQITKDLKPSEADIKQYYDEHKSDMERVHARHVLIRMQGSPVVLKPGQKDLTDAEALAKAQEIHKRLMAGEDFATVARAESDDGGAATDAGDLGTFGHGQMVPAFEDAAFALKAGEISEPVKTQFGYHIIRCEGKEAKTFAQAKDDIEKKLQPEMAQKALKAVEANKGVKLDPEFFNFSNR